jgi:hypothetical protein
VPHNAQLGCDSQNAMHSRSWAATYMHCAAATVGTVVGLTPQDILMVSVLLSWWQGHTPGLRLVCPPHSGCMYHLPPPPRVPLNQRENWNIPSRSHPPCQHREIHSTQAAKQAPTTTNTGRHSCWQLSDLGLLLDFEVITSCS